MEVGVCPPAGPHFHVDRGARRGQARVGKLPSDGSGAGAVEPSGTLGQSADWTLFRFISRIREKRSRKPSARQVFSSEPSLASRAAWSCAPVASWNARASLMPIVERRKLLNVHRRAREIELRRGRQ